MNIAIILIAYNRIESVQCSITYLNRADYGNDTVDLIISIDKSSLQGKIEHLIKESDWKFGKRRIIKFDERQGLYAHVLQCGNLVNDYDAVIVLEDDIIVSESFYLYAKSALEYYGNDENIAGISLYTPSTNIMINQPFTPRKTDSDSFLMQVAQSWGQCWTKNMWNQFRNWLEQNVEWISTELEIPVKVRSWPKSSWLKFYMRYIVKENLYFVYPYNSLSSNSSKKGMHNKLSSSYYQVPLLQGVKKSYKFLDFDLSVKYDIFFEPVFPADQRIFDISAADICFDLYGSKNYTEQKKYILTPRNLKQLKVCSFGLNLRPHECNIINTVLGSDLSLYSLDSDTNNLIKGKLNKKNMVKFHNIINWKDSYLFGFLGLLEALYYKFNNIINKIRK